MKNLIIRVLVIILIASTVINAPYAQSEEINITADPETYCTQFEFSIVHPNVTDKTITGNAIAGETVKILINNQLQNETTVNSNGQFNTNIKELLAGDTVTVQMGENKIESPSLIEENKNSGNLYFSGELNCKNLFITAEKTKDLEEQLAAEAAEVERLQEEQKKLEEEKAAALEIQKEEQDRIETEKIAEETAIEKEQSVEVEQKQEKVEIEQNEEQQKTDEVISDSEKPEIEEVKEPEKLETDEEDADKSKQPTEEETESKNDEDVKEQPLKERSPERIMSTMSAAVTLQTDNYKCGDSNVACVSNRKEFENALSNSKIEIIILNNNITNAGFTVTENHYIHSDSGSKIIDGQGFKMTKVEALRLSYYLNSDSNVNNLVIKNFAEIEGNTGISSDHPTQGQFDIRKNGVNVHFSNINFKTASLSFLTEKEHGRLVKNPQGIVTFSNENNIESLGTGSSITTNSLVLNPNARVNITHTAGGNDSKGGALVFNNGVLDMGINSILNITSDYNGMKSSSSMTVNLSSGSNIDLRRSGANKDARLFDPAAMFNFNGSNISIGAWGSSINGRPAEYASNLDKAAFTVKDNKITGTNIQPQIMNFNSIFNLNDKYRFVVESASQIPSVNKILEGDLTVTGKAAPNARVYMFQPNGVRVDSKADASGQFSFKLASPVQSGQAYKFDAINEGRVIPSKTVVMTAEKAVLEIASVPSVLTFEKTEISRPAGNVKRNDENYYVDIKDTRRKGNWNLIAKASMLTNVNDSSDQLENVLYYNDGSGEKPIENTDVTIASKSNASKNADSINRLSWSGNTGITAKVNPLHATPSAEYKSTVQWTLTDGP